MRLLAAILIFLLSLPALAQDTTPEEERGLLMSFIEDNLSAPNRQIRIRDIDGALSSNARIGLITVADNEGVWLRIQNASIVWSRSALIFSQRLQIDTLSAERIEILRQPIADESLPAPETSTFQVPELPVAINLDHLEVPYLSFGKDVFGLESTISVNGSIKLADGGLDSKLEVTRLDGPGGQFSLAASYTNKTELLSLDLALSEPENGIVATLLNIDGRPPVNLEVSGQGPLSALDIQLALDTAGKRILTGSAQFRGQDDGLGYAVQIIGPIAQLIPAQFRDFFGAQTKLNANGLVKDGGGMRLDALNLESAALRIAASATTSPDGFLRQLNLNATVANATNDPVLLPLPGVRTTVDNASLFLSFGETINEEWSGKIAVANLATPEFTAKNMTFDLGGLARNLDNPAARDITFAVDGLLSGIIATRADIAEALGESISLDIDGSWKSGKAVQLANAILSGNGLSASLAGNIAEFIFNGDIALKARSIAPLSDLALLSRQVQGRLEVNGRAAGSNGVIALTTFARVPRGRLSQKSLTQAKLAFEGTLQEASFNGTLRGDAFLEGVRVQLTAGLGIADGIQRLSDLDFSAGGARATGSLTRNATGLVDGKLVIDAPDISTAAALALIEASGAIDATVMLSSTQDGKQNAQAQATLRNLRMNKTRLNSANINATIDDLFNVPAIDGTINAQGIAAAGVNVSTLSARARSSGGATRFETNATLNNNAQAHAIGTLSPEANGYRIALDKASFGQEAVAARLLEPASLLVQGNTIDIDALVLDVDGGRVAANGRVADTIDLSIDIARLPLSIANLVRPDLKLGGTIDAQASVSGARNAPDARFTLRAQSITAAALRQSGQSMLNINATGNTSGQRLTIDASVTSPEGLRASAQGGLPLDDGTLALDIDLAAFPLAALNTVAPNQNLGGTIVGTARLEGTMAALKARFDLRGSQLSAAALEDAGIRSLQAAASGNFANRTVTLSSVSVSGPQGLSLGAAGKIPLSASGLSLTFNGSVPLALANRFLADRGTQFSGTMELNGSVSGSLKQPAIRGIASTMGAQIVDPDSNVRLRDINIMASMEGKTVTIRSANAALVSGGSISASGTISTEAATGFPADLRISLNQARYADGDMVVATLSGGLALAGPLTRDPLLSGNLNIERAEISIPDNIAGGAAAIDVIHRNPPPAVQQTLTYARANDGTPTPTTRPSVLRLDVNIDAPARIFVRGRGLDTELGGRLRLTGPVTNIQPVGGFELIRGRLSILGQRITFDEGRVTLVGDLDPFINFVASSNSGNVVVFITISGRVSAPDITFSSQPQLPEDEILARLIFNRSIGELSPFQIAQLAAAAAELAGGGNTSLIGSLRSATGLDDLDVVTDSQGNAAVRAGRYIQDNIYLGVEAGAQGTTRGTINLDITENLKARGSVGSDGDSSLGVFFERDY